MNNFSNFQSKKLDVDACCAAWPDEEAWAERATALLGEGELATNAIKELRAKHSTPAQLRSQLQMLRNNWPKLRERLRAQLLPLGELKEMLRQAGAPTEPEQIGINRARLRDSFWQAYCIRRRFTVLDVAARIGLLDDAVKEIFGAGGIWPAEARVRAAAEVR